MKDLTKMLTMQKNKGELSKEAIQAKKDVLQELMDLAHGMLSDKVKGGMDEVRKVTVAAPDKAGLKEGLQKASEIIDQTELSDDQDDNEEDNEAEESEAMMEPLEKAKEEIKAEEVQEKIHEEPKDMKEEPKAVKMDEEEEESPFMLKAKKMKQLMSMLSED